MKNIFTKVFSIALIILIAMSILLWNQFESYDTYKSTDRASFKIEYLDEVLTMSARMAAYTGKKYWVDRYNHNVVILDSILKKAKKDPNVLNQVNMISEANDALVSIELQALNFVKENRLTDAQNILSDVTYQRHKNNYTKGIKNIVSYLNEQNDQDTNKLSFNLKYSLYAIIFLFIVSAIFGIYIVNILQSYNNKLLHMTTELDTLARTDSLTGLFNRRYSDEYIHERIKLFNRFNSTFSLIMLDIDHFKFINDNYGHEIGDDVLQEFAKILSTSVREVDKVFRWGGEEFIIVLPLTDIKNSAFFAEKIRKKIEAHDFKINQQVTASFGVIEYSNKFSFREFIENTDSALYQAKDSGRNKVVAFSQ